MTSFMRYAVYYVPPDGPLARFGAAWLGWDIARAAPVGHPRPAGLDPAIDLAAVTGAARRYGFHATLKPPFRLAEGTTAAGLAEAVAALAGRLAPVRARGLVLSRMGSFLALTPEGAGPDLAALAGRVVSDLDPFRAPAGAAELARRRAAGLTPGQEANLVRWGYPYVMDAFRFHMTLTGPLARPEPVERALGPLLAPVLPAPFVVDSIALVGERADGAFALVHRYALSASSAASA